MCLLRSSKTRQSRLLVLPVSKNLVKSIGSGKSSIISLIERWYDPTSGAIKFYGENLKNLDNKWYHQKQIAIVQQEPILFSGTVRENILYGVDMDGLTPEQQEERLMDACRKANVLTFIMDKDLFP
jgi:ATP-binding cassette, subfamily B (MDR/TAP), member 1